ncbi:leucine-rich_repeat domain-containing protein [Hexamita inflata]|uniref:Leucine-rich_repeat domain-containing protein n=1 Tax=Hexamita inflata TaxID=28002 RepID=A0ABP1GW23_9EUKA
MQPGAKMVLTNQENKNISKHSDVRKTISKQDQTLVERYQNQIQDGTLLFYKNKELKSLNFLRFLNVNTLVFQFCWNIIPKLQSQSIKDLTLILCDISSLNDFVLDNLEVLKLEGNTKQQQLKTVIKEIVRFQKLRELEIIRIKVDISPLSQIIGLTKLRLEMCELRNITVLRQLINLEELSLCKNKYFVDIASLQFLTKLSALYLCDCNLVSLDALRPLSNLQDLIVSQNQIVYIQPLLGLRQLSELSVSNNMIVDIETIQQNHNFEDFDFRCQEQPTQEQLQTANIMRDIQTAVTVLKMIHVQSKKIKKQSQIFKKKIEESLPKQFQDHSQFITQVVSFLNTFQSDISQ